MKAAAEPAALLMCETFAVQKKRGTKCTPINLRREEQACA